MVQLQVLPPLNPLAHKPRSSSFHCSPLTRRRSFPSPRDLSISQSKHQNAIERAAVRKLTAQILASCALPLERPTKSTVLATSAPSFVPAPVSSASDDLIKTPATPPTPLEAGDITQAFETKTKVDIFKNTTKSDELLDLTLTALHRIYIEDFARDSSSLFQPESQSMLEAVRQGSGRAFNQYEHSSPSICGSSVPSASSTPLPTPHSMSPEIVLEIASPGSVTPAGADYPKAGLKPLGRTRSLPEYSHPVLEDKTSLRWFLTELLRRSRASASVVQLALHYLTQARVPVGKILAERFKSESIEARTSGGTGQDDKGKNKDANSPLLDPRRLLLATLVLSTKILHDHAPNNRAWARVCGLDAVEVGKCERALGQALNWELAHMFVGPVDQPLFE